jgi:hypothetical protein
VTLARLGCIPAFALLIITLLGGCERQPRAREREARAAQHEARERERRARWQAEQPLPEEPPVELLRVPNSGLPCDVDEVFARKCRRCHTIPTRHSAPLVFLTWEDTRQDRLGQPLFSVIGRAVRTDFMPYKIEANPKVEPLTPAEKRCPSVTAGASAATSAAPARSAAKSPPPRP